MSSGFRSDRKRVCHSADLHTHLSNRGLDRTILTNEATIAHTSHGPIDWSVLHRVCRVLIPQLSVSRTPVRAGGLYQRVSSSRTIDIRTQGNSGKRLVRAVRLSYVIELDKMDRLMLIHRVTLFSQPVFCADQGPGTDVKTCLQVSRQELVCVTNDEQAVRRVRVVPAAYSSLSHLLVRTEY